MKNYRELPNEYKLLIEQYQVNQSAMNELRENICKLISENEMTIGILMNEMLKFNTAMGKLKCNCCRNSIKKKLNI